MKVGRNDRCPCGSGVKVKRCCGVDGARRSHEAAEELFAAAFCFPRLRPVSASFDAWAAGAPDELSRSTLDAGLAALGDAERTRIETALATDAPSVWAGVVRDLGDESQATGLVLCGAVVAGIEERSRLPEVDELDLDDDAVETLALALEARDLWSVVESGRAVEAFDAGEPLAAIADRLWSDWHEARLALLVERLRRFEAPALAQACAAFDTDPTLARRLRAELLLDSLPSVLDAFRLAA